MTPADARNIIAKKYKYKDWENLHYQVGGTEMDAFTDEAILYFADAKSESVKAVTDELRKEIDSLKIFKHNIGESYSSCYEYVLELEGATERQAIIYHEQLKYIETIKNFNKSLVTLSLPSDEEVRLKCYMSRDKSLENTYVTGFMKGSKYMKKEIEERNSLLKYNTDLESQLYSAKENIEELKAQLCTNCKERIKP